VLKVVIILMITFSGIIVKVGLTLFIGLDRLGKEMIGILPEIRVRVTVFWDRLLYALLVYLFVE